MEALHMPVLEPSIIVWTSGLTAGTALGVLAANLGCTAVNRKVIDSAEMDWGKVK
jgi:hypothetical protein